MKYVKMFFDNISTIFWTYFIIWAIVHSLGYGMRDDTDSVNTRKRSGLTLYTDYGTGLQYIRGGMFGQMIPRLDSEGNHMRVID